MVGGAGADSYVIGADSGRDTILDADDQGTIELAGRSLTGAGELVSTTAATRPYTVWFDDSNAVQPIRYSLNTLTEKLTITGAGSTVVVKDFQSGDLGIATVNYLYAASAVTVSLAATGAQATGGSGLDTLRNIENLAGSRHDDTLTGNALANVLHGGQGHDTLIGGAGKDTLIGGAGVDLLQGGQDNDVYYVDDSADVVTELPGEGTDLVQSAVSYTLPDNVENLTLTGTQRIDATGNALNNLLTGNAADNILSGGAGHDRLSGGAGNDTLIGGAGKDTYLFGRGSGRDTIVIDATWRDTGTDTATDVVQFDKDVALEQLLFDLVEDNLEIRIVGTDDRLTIQDWTWNGVFPVDEFRTGDGHVLSGSQVHDLVDVSASLPPAPMWPSMVASGDQAGLVAANMGALI
ncbi:hypothetical protein GCM10023165_20100 [Variovorax defluvii]|uniref:Haemolysin-type calcium binding-related domain-containing protein n=1 Tax=Variovorax defluvii TaxID=913761 RepID=A0ABP8HK10_9BURK